LYRREKKYVQKRDYQETGGAYQVTIAFVHTEEKTKKINPKMKQNYLP
jgi:hypothetical protein